MIKRNFHSVKMLVLFALILILNSCGLWENFTVYFNTYYNASTLFNQIESDIEKAVKDPFDFKTIPVTAQQKQDLTKVIEKCSKILQFDKNSAYFQDALFIIGKAFYYQEEYAKSQRKFLELASIKENDYSLESQLWLAKTQLKLRNFNEGLALLDSTISTARKSGDDKIFTEGSITRIAFLIYRERYDDAAARAKEFLDKSDNDEVNALVAYQLGIIYEKIKDYDKAVEAFSKIDNYSPNFDVEFKSKFEHARLLIKLNKLDESLTELENLRDDNKFKNYLDQINLAIGELYYNQNKVNDALKVLTMVDSTYSKTESGGKASYDIAKIYEFKIADFDSAKKYYAKTTSSAALKEFKDTSAVRITVFNKYFGLKDQIRKFEDQLRYLKDPVAFERDSIDYYLTASKLQQMQEEEQQNLQQAQQQNQPSFQRGIDNPQPNDSQLRMAETQKLQAAVNWAQQKLQAPVSSASILQVKEIKDVIKNGRLIKPDRPVLSADSLNALLSKNYYDMGNLFFTELNFPDSAFHYYESVINNPNSKAILDKAYFALGSYYETKNRKELADSMYSIIYNDFEKSPLHADVAKILGKVKVESSSDPAEKQYLTAEKKYFDKNYEEAINDYGNVYREYPKSAFAPKSLLAIGMIYEDNLERNDSAAAVYDTLVKKYPVTEYAKAVQGKLQEYQNKIKADEAAKQKALMKEKARQDSLNAAAGATGKDSVNVITEKEHGDSLTAKTAVKESISVKDSLKQSNDSTKPKSIMPDSLKIKRIK